MGKKITGNGPQMMAQLNARTAMKPRRAARELAPILARFCKTTDIVLRLKAGNFTSGEKNIEFSPVLHQALSQNLHPDLYNLLIRNKVLFSIVHISL